MTAAHRPTGRATNFDQLTEISRLVFRDEAALAYRDSFRPRPTDILIASFDKSGTTWLQQIAHGLRTAGDMSFDEINAVTPWIRIAHQVGWDLDADQVAEPRLFKSHAAYQDVPRGGRYLVSFRDPSAAFVSMYRFMEGWWFEPGSIDLETFVRRMYPSENVAVWGFYYHLNSWWEQRHNPDVLLLSYEGMIADHAGAVRKVARFMGLADDEEAIDIATRQSTREFMLAHADHFDERYVRRLGEERAGIQPTGDSLKVTPGTSNADRYTITPSLATYLAALWQEQVADRSGFADYAAFRRAVDALTA